MSILATALVSFLLQAVPLQGPLQGIVLKKGTFEPLSRATVELRRDQENAAILDSATTEDDGRFSLGTVAPGRYRLTAVRRGYTRLPLTITVSSGQPAQDIRLTMTPTASISGRVVDLNGRPMGNVEVKALKASYPEGRRVLTSVQSVQTNDLGEYRLFWLAPGRYYVAAVHAKAQGLFRRIAGNGVGMSASGPVGTLITVEKADPAVLVLDPRAELDATERYAPIFFGGTTDEQKAAGIDLREGADFGAVDIVVGPVQMRHVRGVVVDGVTGKPAQYGSITLPKDLDSPPMKDVKVDRNTATFDMLLFPGSYTVTATSASGEGYATFTVGDADIDNLTIPTTPTFNIRGRIVVEGEPISAAAADTFGALHLTLRRDPPRGEPVTTAYDTPLADGSFTIYASAGDFRINIAPILNVTPSRYAPPSAAAFQGAYVKSIRLGNADVLNAGLHLEGPPSAALEVVIASNPGALEGQVVGQVVRNSPALVADAAVLLIPDNRRRNELYRTTTTDSSGRFHFDRVPPGNYKVLSWEEVEDGAWFDAEFMKSIESRALPVRIGESETGNVRIEVIRKP
jgi:protocatechuate 3,4-dioxygenase beta subunit